MLWGLQQLLWWGVDQKGSGLRSPLPPLPVVCTDWRSRSLGALPGCSGAWWGAKDRWRDWSISSLALALEGTRHCPVGSAPPVSGSFAFHVLRKGGRAWVLAGRCILCIHGGWLLRGRQPALIKAVKYLKSVSCLCELTSSMNTFPISTEHPPSAGLSARGCGVTGIRTDIVLVMQPAEGAGQTRSRQRGRTVADVVRAKKR